MQAFGWMRRHAPLVLIFELPDGARSLLPASWTDLAATDAAAPSSGCSGRSTTSGTAPQLRVVTAGLVHRSRDVTRANVAGDKGKRQGEGGACRPGCN